MQVDTSKFNISMCYTWHSCGTLCDSVVKIWVSKLENYNTCGDATFIFYFHKARYPLKMYWDKALFYSDSLPFYQDSTGYPDSLPRAYAQVWCTNPDPDYDNCMLGGEEPPFILPADPEGYFSLHSDECIFSAPDPSEERYAGPAPCRATDSIVWYGDTTLLESPHGMPINLKILKYDEPVGIETDIAGTPEIIITPHPVNGTSKIIIKNYNGAPQFHLTVYDWLGRPVRKTTFYGDKYIFNKEKLPAGIYLLHFERSNSINFTRKMIIH